MMNKNSLKLVIFAVVLLLGSCGSNPTSTVKFGPSGTTSPGGFTFDMTLSQTIISSGGIINIKVHVITPGGGGAANVPVFFGGDIVAPSVPFVTDSQGNVYATLTTNTLITAGRTGLLTATVEDQTVNGEYQVKP